MIHAAAHPLAGKVVEIKSGSYIGMSYRIEDWWDRIAGKSWGVCEGNPACIDYALRTTLTDIPLDDEVVYGKIDGLGKLIHVSQLD